MKQVVSKVKKDVVSFDCVTQDDIVAAYSSKQVWIPVRDSSDNSWGMVWLGSPDSRAWCGRDSFTHLMEYVTDTCKEVYVFASMKEFLTWCQEKLT